MCYYGNYMAPLSSLDVWHLVASFCLIAITIFLCWALYELMRILRQVDQFMADFREKIISLEEAIESLQERFTSFAGIATMVAQGGKKLASIMGNGKEKRKRALKKELEELEEDDQS